ncbi:MAG: phage portal protein [Burkholderiales bacterium]
MANIIDRVIGYINPLAGLQRANARALLTRAYEGASQRDGWRPRRGGASANSDHMGDATSLRQRARALVQNVPYISRGLAAHVANVIGTGIMPRSIAKGPQAKALNTLWAQWVKVCDADGRQDFAGLERTAVRAMCQDGEVMIRLRNRRSADGLPVPLQLQVLEIDWLDSSRNFTNNGNAVINGIEYDALGKIVNYWLYDRHPGEVGALIRVGTYSRPVPASSIIHLFNTERPGQGRGFTSLASAIARVRDLQLYEDAELQRKNLETRLSVLASGDPADMANPNAEGGIANPDQARRTGDLGQLASGSITQLPPGTELTVVKPEVAAGYVEYIKYNLHLIAAGSGWTYEMMTGDVREVNFSSARVRLLDYRREAEQLQWLTIIPGFCEPVWRAFVEAAQLGGMIKSVDYSVDWATPKWDYVDPSKDVKADRDEISMGLSSISEKLRKRGYDPELVFTEIKTDFDRLKKDGTLDILLQLMFGGQSQPAPPAAPEDAAADPLRP